MTTTLFLIRHGQTDWNLERRWQGHEDVPLNATGREQARRLARRLASRPICALYSSDLARASETARILGAALALEPIFLPTWRELDVGDFQGLNRNDMLARFPELVARMDREHVDPPGGETREELTTRVVPAFEAVLRQHEGESVAVVTHGGVLHAIVRHVLGMEAGHFAPLTLRGNTGLTVVEKKPPYPPLITVLNDTAHLEIEGGAWQ